MDKLNEGLMILDQGMCCLVIKCQEASLSSSGPRAFDETTEEQCMETRVCYTPFSIWGLITYCGFCSTPCKPVLNPLTATVSVVILYFCWFCFIFLSLILVGVAWQNTLFIESLSCLSRLHHWCAGANDRVCLDMSMHACSLPAYCTSKDKHSFGFVFGESWLHHDTLPLTSG